MKKTMQVLFSMALLIVMCLTCGNKAYANEDTVDSGDWKVWMDYDGETGTISKAYIAGYVGTERDLSLPTNLQVTIPYGERKGTTVRATITGIADHNWDDYWNGVFEDNITLNSVTIPEGYVYIGADAFRDCSAFTAITLPKSLVTLGSSCFRECISLTTLDFSETALKTLPECCFEGCTSLTEIRLPESLTLIENYVFKSCASLLKITIPEGVTVLKYEVFANCLSLTEVTFPAKSLVTIGEAAFGGCKALTSITIPDTVVTMESSVFRDCVSLEEAVLSNKTVNLSNDMFYECPSLKKVTLSGNMVMIGNWCFPGNSLEEVVFGGTVEKWKRVNIGDANDALKKAVITCTDGKYHEIHDFSFKQTVVEEASCKAAGKGIEECACGEQQEYVIDQKAHTVETLEAVEATCTSVGKTEGSYCSVCETILKEQKEIAKLPHSVVTDEAVAATCTKAGKTQGSHCSVCETVLTAQKTVAALGHAYASKITIDKAATVKANGSKSYHCTRCTATKGKVTIYAASKISLSKDAFTYNGKKQKPTVTVKNSQGNAIAKANYTVNFETDQKKIGAHTISIVFKNEYSGIKKLSYTIIPANISIDKLKAGKKAFTVSWKKDAQVTGYEIQYATNANFNSPKTVTIKKTATVTTTVSKLKAPQKYFVRIRSYKKVGSKNFYSNWSKVKNITTKK